MKKRINICGFTLIELLAVIVILGILMLIAIPSVTKYISNTKKEAYIKTIANMAEVIRNGVITEDQTYNMQNKTVASFSLKDIELEKGSNKSPYGEFDSLQSYILVTKTNEGYTYQVQAKDEKGYCIELSNIDELTKNHIKKCSDITLVNPPIYKTYSIGEKITYAGSSWYVIKDSDATNDYVTLLKEKVLTSTELGEYAANYTTICKSWMVESGEYGCVIEGETVTQASDTMSYYWNDTCHREGRYGYTENNFSGCEGHNNYEGSKVKEYLEGTYINTLEKNNLKQVDGYQIRLITIKELNENFERIDSNDTMTTNNKNDNVPLWIYKNFGDTSSGGYGYWTMTPHSSLSYNVWMIYDSDDLYNHHFIADYYSVRPVINLLKSSI